LIVENVVVGLKLSEQLDLVMELAATGEVVAITDGGIREDPRFTLSTESVTRSFT
jgi:hypothetical protein